jgi:hypothetical protein
LRYRRIFAFGRLHDVDETGAIVGYLPGEAKELPQTRFRSPDEARIFHGAKMISVRLPRTGRRP